MKNNLAKHFAIIAIIAALTMLSSCEGDKPTKVNAMQTKDKVLGCSDILLEINEAEYYRKEAEKSKSLGVKTVIAPIGYLDTYMNAGDAVAAADARINYLNRIYEIRKCSNDQLSSNPAQAQGQGGQVQMVNNVPVVQNTNPYQQQTFGQAGTYTGAQAGVIQMQVPQQVPQQQMQQQIQYQQAPQQYQQR